MNQKNNLTICEDVYRAATVEFGLSDKSGYETLVEAFACYSLYMKYSEKDVVTLMLSYTGKVVVNCTNLLCCLFVSLTLYFAIHLVSHVYTVHVYTLCGSSETCNESLLELLSSLLYCGVKKLLQFWRRGQDHGSSWQY